jgi:branched-chain amino acid transport system substrate-binding protein
MSKLNALKFRRRNNLRRFGIGIILLVCFFTFGFSQALFAAGKGPIKIGFIAPLSGGHAKMGMDMVSGFKMYLDEIGYTVAGRKIELIVQDEQNPNVAVTTARKFIKHDKVDLIAGVLLTGVAYALTPLVTEEKVPLVVCIAAGDDVTQRKRSEYVTRLSFSASEVSYITGDYAYKELGWRKAITFAWDRAWGHESAGGFHRAFEAAGGQVIQKIWPPAGTVDFGPYVANLAKEADGIFDCITGGATIRFLKALKDTGREWKVIGTGPVTDETFFKGLKDLGLGVYTVFPYSAALDNPKNKEYQARGRKILKGQNPPSYFSICYTSARWIVETIKAMNGDIEDKDLFIKTLRSLELDTIRGPLKLDKYGHPIQNQYVRKVEKVNGVYQNTIVKTYPMATQFFTFDPEVVLNQPGYSRDYPPCKYCK